MLLACWAAKGGSGTTVVAAALAAMGARRGTHVIAADLAGDLPAALGVAEPASPGIAEWLAAGPDVASDSLSRLEVAVAPNLGLIPWGGTHQFGAGDGERLAAALASHPLVVADCGTAPIGAAQAVAMAADRSLLVIRPCYLALRRALATPFRPSAVVLIDEAGRSLRRADVADVLGVPVVAVIPWEPGIARAVDAGLLAGRVPRALARGLSSAA